MTYAYLKRYSPSTDKRGFYIDGPNWTLQTSHRADRFFRQSTSYHDDTELPLTIVKTLIHLGEAETGDRTSKDEILSWFPQLRPEYCDMDQRQISELEDLITDCLQSTELSDADAKEFNRFLLSETPVNIPW
jgi:hypothetical protein